MIFLRRPNKRLIRLIGTLCVVAAMVSVSRAQDSSGTLYLKILDSTTGGAVAPGKILVDNKPVDFQVEAGSLVALSLPDGSHEISVNAKDHSSMKLSAMVAGADTPVMEIELDPTSASQPETVPDGMAILEGSVTDADTGALLPNVTLTLPKADKTTVTGESGYFSFELAVGDKESGYQPAVALNVKADGYASIHMKNVTLSPGERRRMQVRLDHATTDTLEPVEIDDSAGVGSFRNSDWTYDVTIR